MIMPDPKAADVSRSLFAALEHETRVNLHRDRISLEFADGVATLSGEVADIAAKRLTLELAAAIPAVTGIVDRLHTRPVEQMGDGEIADHLERALTDDSSFNEIPISRRVGEKSVVIRDVPGGRYASGIEFRVEDGVITLDGEVPSLSHKRLAGAFAWWVPGSRDVINGLGVEPRHEDSDNEILDALRLVLEKDRLVDASQIKPSCENAVITLRGLVENAEQKRLAEHDAWALFGVDDVVNEIAIA